MGCSSFFGRASFGLDCERAGSCFFSSSCATSRFFTLAAHVCRPACSFFSGKGACTLSPTTPRLICCFDDEDSSHRFHRQHFCLTKGRAWATSRVYRRAAALDSHRINHRRWFCAASIATHICSRRDRAIRIFNFPPKAAHLSAPRNSFSFAAAFQDVQNTGTISKTFGSIAPKTIRISVSIISWQPNSLEHISCRELHRL